MRIAMIDPSLFTWPYDAELASALRRAGNEVVVYGRTHEAVSGGSATELLRRHFYRRLEAPWINRLPRPLFLMLKGISHFLSMRGLLRILRAERPDVIHFQWTPLPAVDRWFMAPLRRIAPTVLTVHDSAPFNNNPGAQMQRWGATGILSHFDHLIVHTRAAARRVESYGVDGRRVSVIPHGPLGGGFTMPVCNRSSAADEASGIVRVLLFGKIKPYKGLDVLLRAWAALPSQAARRCRLRVVGAPYMDMAPLIDFARQAGIGDSIDFDLRFISDSEIPAILAQADIMVMPYREIDASGVLMTALCAGLPIVASRIGLFAELLQEGVHGRLVLPEDPQALATALSELILDKDLRVRMRERVLALRASIPDWREIADRTLRLYGETIAQWQTPLPLQAGR
jgi:glycosyltransferase involved in cell wall biosynthesis